jgi:hypothetical protein
VVLGTLRSHRVTVWWPIYDHAVPDNRRYQTGGGTYPIERMPSAYGYPLLIKHLLHTPLVHAPEQEIVYRDLQRYDYRTLRRIGQLANALAGLGVGPGDTVAVMDWDSHRHLECYFAVPMMGAVLRMVNIRLSPKQILYTTNHAEATFSWSTRTSCPYSRRSQGPDRDREEDRVAPRWRRAAETSLEVSAEYEELLVSNSAEYDLGSRHHSGNFVR